MKYIFVFSWCLLIFTWKKHLVTQYKLLPIWFNFFYFYNSKMLRWFLRLHLIPVNLVKAMRQLSVRYWRLNFSTSMMFFFSIILLIFHMSALFYSKKVFNWILFLSSFSWTVDDLFQDINNIFFIKIESISIE